MLILFLVLPLWFGFAWLAGFIRFGPDPVPIGEPTLELVTTRPFNDALVCIGRDYSGRLGSLRSIAAPSPEVRRFWARMDGVIIEVAPGAEGAVIRAYEISDRNSNYREAVEHCARN